MIASVATLAEAALNQLYIDEFGQIGQQTRYLETDDSCGQVQAIYFFFNLYNLKKQETNTNQTDVSAMI